MSRSQLLGLARWVQRIREQEQSVNYPRLFSGQHGCLPASVGMPTKKNATTCSLLHHSNGTRQSFTVARAHCRKWRAMRACLAKGKITPQHMESSLAERT